MTGLASRCWLGALVERCDNGSVVCVDSERSAFQEVVEMFDGQVDAKEFFVESGINTFRFAQLAKTVE